MPIYTSGALVYLGETLRAKTLPSIVGDGSEAYPIEILRRKIS